MDSIINVKKIDKIYKMYDKPMDRIKEAFLPNSKKDKAKSFYALEDISFSVNKGETVGIIGKNGSGKSTLLKILTGVISQTNGEKDIKGNISALLELGAGFNPEYTGLENIYLSGTIMGISKEKMDEKIEEITTFAEIGDFINRPVKNYSSGMFVRLAFAVAINVNPDILIVDEALAVGDYRFQAKCYNKFEELKKNGKTILFVTHDVDAVRRFCTRAIWIDCGKIVLDGDVNEVTSKYMEFITGNRKNAEECSADEGEKVISSEFNPINRFGSHVGCINSVRVFNGEKETDVFSNGDEIKILMEANIPEGEDLKNIGAAISIKDKNGLDLMVSALHDKGISFKKHGKNEVIFTFKNYLNSGEYSIIAALENREVQPILYYDYIEGAAYIKTICDKEYFGLLRFPSDIEIGE